MLSITIPEIEKFDEATSTFFTLDRVELLLEHSLASLSKWESRWEKPFIGTDKNTEETLSYIKDMLLSPLPYPEALERLSNEDMGAINDYVNSKQTATWFREDGMGGRNNDVITAELVYYWMVAQQIPMECQYWHFNRLMTLLRVINEKNKPASKRRSSFGKRDVAAQRRALNEQRLAKYNTTG